MTDPDSPPVPDSPEPPQNSPLPDEPGVFGPPNPPEMEPGGLTEASYVHAWQPGATMGESGNVLDDRPHFLRYIEGRDDQPVCGQDGETWPCRAWQELSGPGQMPAHSYEQDDRDVPTGVVSVEQAARVAGMSPGEFRKALHG